MGNHLNKIHSMILINNQYMTHLTHHMILLITIQTLISPININQDNLLNKIHNMILINLINKNQIIKILRGRVITIQTLINLINNNQIIKILTKIILTQMVTMITMVIMVNNLNTIHNLNNQHILLKSLLANLYKMMIPKSINIH